MRLDELVRQLEALVPDPRRGLPEPVFLLLTRLTPMVNVDLLIQDEHLGTLLTWRDDVFCGQGWHVPGGIIRVQETAADRIRAVGRGELGVEVTFEEGPAAVNGLINRDQTSRGHFISLLYRCRLASPLDEARRFRSDRPVPDAWEWHRAAPAGLIPGHELYRPYLAAWPRIWPPRTPGWPGGRRPRRGARPPERGGPGRTRRAHGRRW